MCEWIDSMNHAWTQTGLPSPAVGGSKLRLSRSRSSGSFRYDEIQRSLLSLRQKPTMTCSANVKDLRRV
jgi:hypothetical protein